MIQVIVNGLLIGAVYSLIAVGLTMIHGVMKIVNFAQGELLMVGMYTTYVLYGILMPEGSAPYLLIVPVCIIMFLFGTIVFKATVSHVIGKSETSYIILTIGISYLLRYGFQMIFGSNYQSIHVSESLKFGSVALGGIVFTTTRLIAFFAALILRFLSIIFSPAPTSAVQCGLPLKTRLWRPLSVLIQRSSISWHLALEQYLPACRGC